MKTVVITDRETREVIACVPEYGEAICKKDVSVSVFDGTEPIFLESENGIKLSTSKFLINSGDKIGRASCRERV